MSNFTQERIQQVWEKAILFAGKILIYTEPINMGIRCIGIRMVSILNKDGILTTQNHNLKEVLTT